ncbi:type IX secretion system protein PorG [Flavobacterium pedocola]
MNRIVLVAFFLLLFSETQAQIHEIGVFVGGSNYIGDVGPTDYISPNELSLGLLYKWNRSKRHSWRFSYTQGKITSDDLDSDAPSRYKRGYSFENEIKELSAGLEFNFFDFNLHDSGWIVTPYVHSGLSYFRYDELYVINGQTEIDESKWAFAIPMTVGIKSRIADKFVLGLETSIKYSFTDNLDGSNPKNDDYNSLRFGNLNSKDWYVFTGLTLTYTFGQNPCYCAE